MATEIRPRVDQENASALNIKGGNVSGIKLRVSLNVSKKEIVATVQKSILLKLRQFVGLG